MMYDMIGSGRWKRSELNDLILVTCLYPHGPQRIRSGKPNYKSPTNEPKPQLWVPFRNLTVREERGGDRTNGYRFIVVPNN
jgi:hypothetical protein